MRFTIAATVSGPGLSKTLSEDLARWLSHSDTLLVDGANSYGVTLGCRVDSLFHLVRVHINLSSSLARLDYGFSVVDDWTRAIHGNTLLGWLTGGAQICSVSPLSTRSLGLQLARSDDAWWQDFPLLVRSPSLRVN